MCGGGEGGGRKGEKRNGGGAQSLHFVKEEVGEETAASIQRGVKNSVASTLKQTLEWKDHLHFMGTGQSPNFDAATYRC